MEEHKCKEKGINDIGFLDPTSINRCTINFRSTVDIVCDAFLHIQDKKGILLPYKITVITVIFMFDVLNAVTIIF